MNTLTRTVYLIALATSALFCIAGPVRASDIPAEVSVKVDKAKKRLVELAADPAVIAAVRDANAQNGGAMNNGKWIELGDTDPAVKQLLATPVSVQIAKWEKADESVNKLILRDQKGNLVAASVRPLIYNNANRPVFANPIKGQAWSAGEIKPDTTTQIPSVHVAAPVMDGGKPIGVLQAGVSAK